MKSTYPRTIGRNRRKLIAELFAKATNCRVYSLDNEFNGAEITPTHIAEAHRCYEYARLRQDSETHYTIHVHSNRWYEFDATA